MTFAGAGLVIKDAILRVCSSETLAYTLRINCPPVTVALPRCDSLGVDAKLQGACDEHTPKGPCAVVGEVEPLAGVIQSNFGVFHPEDFCAGVLVFPFNVHPLEQGQEGGVDWE